MAKYEKEFRINLEGLMVDINDPKVIDKWKEMHYHEYGWRACDQLDALEFYLPNVKYLYKYMKAFHHGKCFAVFQIDDDLGESPTYVLWRDNFGSCSGCDALYGCNLYEGAIYIAETLAEGNTKQFDSLDNLTLWVLSQVVTDGFYWEEFPFYDFIKTVRSTND